VEREEEADILLFNTCSVREQAENKAIGKIGILKRLKREKPDIYIGVMGCMAQNRKEELLEKLPHLDFVIGTEKLHKLPEIIEKEIKNRHKEIQVGEDLSVLTGMGAHFKVSKDKVSSFIAIMRGCNRFCSYCIVPYVRGREKSREISDIADEAKKLVDAGIKEIFLLGQNVAAFGLDGKASPGDPSFSPFADLLEELNKIEGLARIRFTSPHPAYFNDRLINAMAELPKVCESLHLPLQSGSDRILKLMNRNYSAAQYMEIIKKLKARIPEITFSTDVIVAFPGETDEDFNATRNIMNEVGFDNAYIFKYSPRKGTKAAEMPDQIPQNIKEERNQALLADLAERTKKHNAEMVGKKYEILVEGPSKRNPERWSGRTRTNKVVIFEPDEKTGRGNLMELNIFRCTSMSLFGKIDK
jgi:tRNA-2-methylthio-N6-dimethylallyladenosine synthase